MHSIAIRAVRRRLQAAVKARARQIYPHDPQAKSANHLKRCSCWMCGNPRKHMKQHTRQEEAFRIAMEQEIHDLDMN